MDSQASEIIKFIREKYKKTGNYRFTSKDILQHLESIGRGTTTHTVSVTLSRMKKRGIIANLGEKRESVEDSRAYYKYFTLTEILEKITTPNKEEGLSVKIPDQPANNPFDKVNERFDLVLAQLKGLANGYAELASKPTRAVNISELADAVNVRLNDLGREDSFIYAIKEELGAEYVKLIENQQDILSAVQELKVPSSVANPDDYHAGIKEGIKLAVELGITVKPE